VHACAGIGPIFPEASPTLEGCAAKSDAVLLAGDSDLGELPRYFDSLAQGCARAAL